MVTKVTTPAGGRWRRVREDKMATEPVIRTGVAETTRPRTWLLVPSFLLGPEIWRGVAEVLELLGQTCIIPDPGRTTPADADHLTPWVADVVAAVPADIAGPMVVCGYSATSPRLPLVVDALLKREVDVVSMVVVNGRLPEDGAIPTERDSPFMDTLDALVRPDDYLPPWHRWWGPMVEDMLPDDDVRQRILSECRATPRAVFDQPIPAPELPARIGTAFLGLGDMYLPCYDGARDDGWAVMKVEAEHLDLVVKPLLVAGALLSLCRQAEVRSPNRAS